MTNAEDIVDDFVNNGMTFQYAAVLLMAEVVRHLDDLNETLFRLCDIQAMPTFTRKETK